jgi:hypothetical protein
MYMNRFQSEELASKSREELRACFRVLLLLPKVLVPQVRQGTIPNCARYVESPKTRRLLHMYSIYSSKFLVALAFQTTSNRMTRLVPYCVPWEEHCPMAYYCGVCCSLRHRPEQSRCPAMVVTDQSTLVDAAPIVVA